MLPRDNKSVLFTWFTDQDCANTTLYKLPYKSYIWVCHINIMCVISSLASLLQQIYLWRFLWKQKKLVQCNQPTVQILHNHCFKSRPVQDSSPNRRCEDLLGWSSLNGPMIWLTKIEYIILYILTTCMPKIFWRIFTFSLLKNLQGHSCSLLFFVHHKIVGQVRF